MNFILFVRMHTEEQPRPCSLGKPDLQNVPEYSGTADIPSCSSELGLELSEGTLQSEM